MLKNNLLEHAGLASGGFSVQQHYKQIVLQWVCVVVTIDKNELPKVDHEQSFVFDWYFLCQDIDCVYCCDQELIS